MSEPASPVPDFYDAFKVLIDGPAADPGAGFGIYARSLGDIVLHSEPHFAVGVFGDWGSGKTTLMRAIEHELAGRDDVVCVWFNAWRYERETHLIVPLLDTLREALAGWADLHEDDADGQARQVAAVVGRVARALLAGFSLQATLPLGFITAEFDSSRALERLKDPAPKEDQPVSFYHGSFRALEGAIEPFVAEGKRIVVFIDDLDRCLPLSALDVLESMKLFFDLEGFVFVVGLDQAVIERSVELKYATIDRAADTATGPPQQVVESAALYPPEGRVQVSHVSGADYIKKIFQVPFTLPPIPAGDLESFFEEVVKAAALPDTQHRDLELNVRPHLEYISSTGQVNPREVKRLINAYVVQMKMLSAKLGNESAAGGVNPQIVLGLLTMRFRPEWRSMYDVLAANPKLFIDSLEDESSDARSESSRFWLTGEPLPAGFVDYVSARAPALLEVELEPYISSADAGQVLDRNARLALSSVNRLRKKLYDLRGGTAGNDVPMLFRDSFRQLQGELEAIDVRDRSLAFEPRELANSLEVLAGRLEPNMTETTLREWGTDAARTLERLSRSMLKILRQAAVS